VNDHKLKNILRIKDNQNTDMASKYSVVVSPTSLFLSRDGVVIRKLGKYSVANSTCIRNRGSIKKI